MRLLPSFKLSCPGVLRRLRDGALAWILLALTAPLSAQETQPASVLQTKVSEWIRTLQLISEEKTAWALEKETLTDLNAIRKSEIEKLDEFIRAAEERVQELDEKRQAYAAEEAEMKEWRRDLERRIGPMEETLRPLTKVFPLPLREKVEEAVLRLEEPDPQAPLQNRVRDVLRIVQAMLEFHNSLNWDNEIREIDGQQREVSILYLGLTRAYYVDPSGKYAGFGSPAAEGWRWVEAPQLAESVRLAIDVLRTDVPPKFVTLPVGNLPNP